jgi:3-dehydroquinate dehydratase
LAKDNQGSAKQQSNNSDKLEQRLDMLDRRLDDIDSMVSAAIERVMSQPVTLQINCPNCGKNIEISLVGVKKPGV